MQFRILTALIVFLGSYLPLSMILLVQNYAPPAPSSSLCWRIWDAGCDLPLKSPSLSVSIFCLCAACFLTTLTVLRVVKPKYEIELIEAKYVPTDLMNYTLPYVVSFMGIDYQETSKFVGLLVFLLWMFWITYKSGQVMLNPVLIVLGWRLYDLTYQFPADPKKQKSTGKALSKQPLSAGESRRQESLGEVLLIKP